MADAGVGKPAGAKRPRKTSGNVVLFEIHDADGGAKTLTMHSQGFPSSTVAFKSLADEAEKDESLCGRKFCTGTINSEIKSPAKSVRVSLE